MNVTTIGLDQAKSVFQAHGVDEAGRTVLVKKLHRKQMLPFVSTLRPCLIGIEACATAHHWARTLSAMGHEVRLMPPSYVKGYVKRGILIREFAGGLPSGPADRQSRTNMPDTWKQPISARDKKPFGKGHTRTDC